MDNRKKLFVIFSAFLLVLAVVSLSMPRDAFSQATIPTRTPKPDPTDDSGGGGGGGENKPNPPDQPDPTAEPTQEALPPTAVPPAATAVPTQVIPTQTQEPILTHTPTATPLPLTETPFAVVPGDSEEILTVTIKDFEFVGEVVAFPENNAAFPEAGPCDLPPTFTTSGALSVFAGPGSDYPIAGLIGEAEVRPIIGRAVDSNWWLIQLDETGRVGWVNDDLGIVYGFTDRVPIIAAPAQDGVVPTPGSSIWSPTPVAGCDAPELLIGAAVDQDAGGFNVVPPSSKPDSLETLYDGFAPDQAPSADGTGQKSGVAAQAGERSTEAEVLLTDLAKSAQPLELPAASSSEGQLPNLMPVVGFVMILLAIIIGFFARKGRTSSGDVTE
jgi:hypothetical protein